RMSTLTARQTARVEKLTPGIGAEILDIDVTRLSDEDVAWIRRLLLENLVIFFREQALTPDQHKAFAGRFGTLITLPKPRKGGLLPVPGHPEIAVIATDENSVGATGDTWH